MPREVHGTLSQQLYMERPRAVSDVRITADYSASDVCVQTGGVFSSQFLRDRAAVRRLSDMSDGDHHNQQQKKKTGLSFSPSSQLVYEDPSGILRLERMNSERNNKVYPNNTSKYQWEYSATGQASGEYADEITREVQSGHTMPPLYAPDSPCSCYPLGAGFGDFSANGKMKFLCSFGGRILPRPNDGKLRYVGGETHIISIRKNISYEELSKKTYAVCKYPHTIKYQLPGEDLDSLISICSGEDLHHLIEEYHELENAEGSQRLRIFLDYCESPTSIEERAVQPIDVDYQYVAAVDGMLDPTLHSPNFRTASSHTTDLKDAHSPMPNLAEMLPRPSGQLLNPIQIPRKAFNQSPLNSPVTVMQKDFKNVDSTCAEDARNFIPFVSEKRPRDTVYYVDAIGRHNHLYHGSQLMDYHHEKFRVETDETYEVLNVHFPRGSSVDFEPAPNWGLSDTHSVKTMLKERAVNYEQLCSDAEYSMQLTSGTTHMGQRIMHSHSEPLLQEQDQKSNHGGFYPLTSFIDSDQSPSLAMSISLQDLSTMWKQRVDGVFQDAKYENHRKVASGSENETYEECNFDEKKANFNGGMYVPSLDDDQKYKYFQHVDYQQNGCLLKEVQSFRGRFSAERGLELETSADTTGGPTLVYHLETTAPKYFEESQYSTKDKQTTSNIIIKDADLKELQELGSGTFGTVFHGKWRGTDVAIKRINKSCFSGSFSEQERLTRDFWREAKILSTLHHPNVLAFYGVVPDGPDGTLATVTEYMVNGSLRHVLLRKDRVLDRRKRLIIAMDAASGMEYLHLKNIIHFDLNCDNLLVNLRVPERPVCKVGDFGLSRIKRNTLASGGTSGTLPWMAPELLDSSSSKVSEKVDVFSFGIAMWEILTGEEPYASMHCGAIISGIVSNTLRPLIPKRCDPEWKRLMEECWSPEPAARPSFTEITNRLRSMSVAVRIRKRPNVTSR